MKLVQAGFVFVIFGVFLVAHFYVYYRIWQMIPNNVVAQTVFVILAVSVLASFILFFVGRNFFSLPVMSVLYKVGTSWFFIFIYLLILLLLLDLLRITHLLPVGQWMTKSWLGLGVLTGVVAVIMIAGYINYFHKERVSLQISVDKGNTVNDSLKIVAIADMHLGHSIGSKEFKRWVELINKENPDLLLIAGDIIDNDCRPLYQQRMEEIFRTIKTKYGIYAALGNHEYISDVSKSMEFLKQAGVIVLRDSAVLVNDWFYIVGRDDKSNSTRKPIEELTQTLDKTKPIIMLDHQPYNLEKVEENNIDLQISGHTHYGQLIPISWITRLMYEKPHGYLQKGNSHIYTTSGIGIWGGKFRVGTNSEFVVIDFMVK